MVRYTFGDVLPLSGAAAPLLTAAVRYAYPTTLTELAKAAGISKFAASRAAQTLTEADLLHNGGGGYEFNVNHPMADSIQRLAWRFSGVRREELWDPYSYRRPLEGVNEDYNYRRLVPQSLQRGMPVPPALQVAAGPDLVTSRDTCDWFVRQAVVLREFEQDGQDVYRLWSNERLRDLIHQTLSFGGALGVAHETLASACGSDVQEDGSPFQVRVSSYAWTRATYLVSAEARDVLRVIGLLDQAMWVGYRVNRLRSEALHELNAINYSGRDSDFFDLHLSDALEAEQAAGQLWDDPSHGPWHNIGGTPRPEDVGTAGDQIIAVRLMRAAQTLAAQVAKMADMRCVQEWIDDNHDEAQDLPLVSEVPRDELRGQRDWPAEKPRPGSGTQ